MSDEIDMLKTAGLSSTGVLVVLIAYRVLKGLNGHRLVSSCCGHKADVGFVVEQMTPKRDEIVVQVNPLATRS